MDYETARDFLIRQGQATEPDAFLVRLQRGEPPVPGQVTSILLALKLLRDALQTERLLERKLVLALYHLAMQSRQQFEVKRRSGVLWPPLLDEDVGRIAAAVEAIFGETVL